MIIAHLVMNNARLVVSKSVKSMPKIRNIWLLDITTKQHGNISFHGGMISSVPQIFIVTNDRMQGLLTMATYPIRYVPIIEA
jgi:prolipoprotein diacylglyceryltransferase